MTATIPINDNKNIGNTKYYSTSIKNNNNSNNNNNNKIEPSKKGYINIGLNSSSPNKVYYETYGNGPKKILFICGFLTPLKSYIKQVDYFARLGDEYEICLFDNRGVSQSMDSSLKYSYNFSTNSMAKDALDVVNYLNWKEYHIIGLSMGGMASLHLASMVPERVKSLSISSIPNGYKIPLFSNGVRLYINGLFMKDQKKKFFNFLSLMYSDNYLNEPSPQDKSISRFELMYKKELLKKESPSFLTTLGHQMGYAFFYLSKKKIEIINKNEIPIVYIHGIDDKISTLKHLENTVLKQLNVNGFFKLNGGHTINLEQSKEFNSIVENHILNNHQKVRLSPYQPQHQQQNKSLSFNYLFNRSNILQLNNLQRNTTFNLFKSKFSTFIKFITK